MSALVVAIGGTGTDVGKTFVACALVRALARVGLACGVKPFESGHEESLGADQLALATVSSVSASDLGLRLRTFPSPVAPPEAARRAGESLSGDAFLHAFQDVRARFDGVLVLELAGGLFSPFDERRTNADVVRCLGPEAHVLVAPNRLGVLHDVRATVIACQSQGVAIDALVLTHPKPPAADASCQSNPAALASWMQSTPIVLSHCDSVDATELLLDAWTRGAMRRRSPQHQLR